MSRFFCFLFFLALFIDLLTDKVQPLSRCLCGRSKIVNILACPAVESGRGGRKNLEGRGNVGLVPNRHRFGGRGKESSLVGGV